MSIFKRLSGKKSGENTSDKDESILDERAQLNRDFDDVDPIPQSEDDAIPSLGTLSESENKLIYAILTDQDTSEFKAETPLKAEDELDIPELPTQNHRSVDEILNDDSYKSALSVLKGDFEAEDTNDDEEPLIKWTHSSSEKEDEISGHNTDFELADTTHTSLTESQELVTEELEASSDGEPEMTIEPENTERDESVVDKVERPEIRAEEPRSGQPIQGSRRVNLGDMRMDVANIISDIETGDSMFRRAQQRVSNLTNYIERAEVDFSLLDRLEPENRALKSENLALRSEIDKGKIRISQLMTNLEDLQRRYGDAQSELDSTYARLSQSDQRVERTERDLSEVNRQLKETELRSDRFKNDLDVENRENANLRDRVAKVIGQLDTVTAEKLGLAKKIETLKIDLADQSEGRTKLRNEVSDLRYALEDAQRQNTKIKGEISTVHEDIRGFKTQYEFNILKRDERITELEQKITELNDRLRMKEDIIENTTRDISNLRKERTTQDLERERLETTLSEQSRQLNQTEKELLLSKQTADELDQRYREVATALAKTSELRQSATPSENPDIRPELKIDTDDIAIDESGVAPVAERIAPSPTVSDDIEDMLTDYKLGIRQNL